MTLDELRKLARLSGTYVRRGAWFATGDEVWMGREQIGRMCSGALAEYVCRVHNAFLFLANGYVQAKKRAADLKRLLDVKVRGKK